MRFQKSHPHAVQKVQPMGKICSKSTRQLTCGADFKSAACQFMLRIHCGSSLLTLMGEVKICSEFAVLRILQWKRCRSTAKSATADFKYTEIFSSAAFFFNLMQQISWDFLQNFLIDFNREVKIRSKSIVLRIWSRNTADPGQNPQQLISNTIFCHFRTLLICHRDISEVLIGGGPGSETTTDYWNKAEVISWARSLLPIWIRAHWKSIYVYNKYI